MNSLVVLFSVVAFAAAKPSGLLGGVAYSSPIIAAAPAAVSSQSRVDIKSSPAVLSTAAYSPISHAIIAEPTLLSAPAAIAAPSAVSSQSRIDIKSTPAVTTSVISTAPIEYSASGLVKTAFAAPAISAYSGPAIATSAIAAPSIAYSAPAISAYAAPAISAYATNAISAYATNAISAYATPAISTYAAPAISTLSAPVISTYSAPAIATPTLIKTAAIATPSVPLDTPEVIAARAAHLETKWLTDAHLIRKRSVVATPLLSTHIGSPIVSTYAASSPFVSTYAAGHLGYSAPLGWSTPLVAKAYGVHAW